MVATSLRYLVYDELYREEKPFEVEFEIDERDGVRKSNLNLVDTPVIVHPIDEFKAFDLNIHGFCILEHDLQLDLQSALESFEQVDEAYFDALVAILHQKFPEYKRIEPFELTVRQRHVNFPSDAVATDPHEQPACLPHSDYSARGARLQLSNSFPGQEKHFETADFDMINVWKVLIGPNDDWPLALCDFTSIDPKQDPRATDRVLLNRVAENQLLLYNENHRWYFIPRQQTNQLLVLRNTDSSGKRAIAFHAAFLNPDSRDPPRRSCEARFVAFR